MTLLLVAHGTRDPAGTRVVESLAAAVRARLPGVHVALAYADVRPPDVTTALPHLPPASPTLRTRESNPPDPRVQPSEPASPPFAPGESPVPDPVVVVPAFLAAGYHVRVDIPGQIRRSGRPAVLTPCLGPALVPAAHERLVEAGWRRGDPVVLAAAGSSDPRARADVARAAARLGELTGGPVRVGYVAGTGPRIADMAAGYAVASWFLAPGLFHRIAAASGAALVAEPLGAHPLVADLVVRRYRTGIIEGATTLLGA